VTKLLFSFIPIRTMIQIYKDVQGLYVKFNFKKDVNLYMYFVSHFPVESLWILKFHLVKYFYIIINTN
jgi:hypothetical protein